MMGFFFIFLQYLELVRGYGTLTAALAVIPLAVGMMPASTAAASLASRFSAKYVGAAGLALSAAGFVWLAQLTVASSYWPILFGMIIVGPAWARHDSRDQRHRRIAASRQPGPGLGRQRHLSGDGRRIRHRSHSYSVVGSQPPL